MAKDGTRVDAIIDRVKNHPAAAVLIAGGLMVIAIAAFTDAARGLFDFAAGLQGPAPIEVTVAAPVVSIRWSGWKAGAQEGLWHPVRGSAYENELRLPLVFTNRGPKASTIAGVDLRSESNGRQLAWEGVYEADSEPLENAAPVEDQIRGHRTPLEPFSVAPGSEIRKVIDFVPADHPGPVARGAYTNTLQVRMAASTDWLETSRFAFTIPAGFDLEGVDASGVKVYRYNYWQTFPIDKP